MLTAWGCLIVTGQYALVAFLALDLNQGAGLTLAEGSILARHRQRRRASSAACSGASSATITAAAAARSTC